MGTLIDDFRLFTPVKKDVGGMVKYAKKRRKKKEQEKQSIMSKLASDEKRRIKKLETADKHSRTMQKKRFDRETKLQLARIKKLTKADKAITRKHMLDR